MSFPGDKSPSDPFPFFPISLILSFSSIFIRGKKVYGQKSLSLGIQIKNPV
jgi:hypothetical protein